LWLALFREYKSKPDMAVYSAGRSYNPSYVNLHTALASHGLIPESVVQITRVTSLKTARFKNDFGEYSYHSVRDDLMFGYESRVLADGRAALYPTREKALHWRQVSVPGLPRSPGDVSDGDGDLICVQHDIAAAHRFPLFHLLRHGIQFLAETGRRRLRPFGVFLHSSGDTRAPRQSCRREGRRRMRKQATGEAPANSITQSAEAQGPAVVIPVSM
jgi:hypothetical protein